MMRQAIFIEAYGLACALGADKDSVRDALFFAQTPSALARAALTDGREVLVGRLPFVLESGSGTTRTNRLVAHCYNAIAADVAAARERVGAHRLAVVIGTCTSGIGEVGERLKQKLSGGAWRVSLEQQLLDYPARHAVALSEAAGPCYAISTACTSGARALAAGARLIQAGLCDAVLCGGVDSLCELTLNGFAALESLSRARCNPMSVNRDGINIGEACALFLLSRAPSAYRLSGWGESADAYHISAPDPQGGAAEGALRKALAHAGLAPSDIGFVHLHGTATRLNDAMEASVIHRLFGPETPASSTKPLTGHTLGAAGAIQAAFCLMALEEKRLPPHWWDGALDPALPDIRLAAQGEALEGAHAVSANYAFGGNNAALVVSRA